MLLLVKLSSNVLAVPLLVKQGGGRQREPLFSRAANNFSQLALAVLHQQHNIL
jgi:hypothetical protein